MKNLKACRNQACGYDGRVLRNSLCPTGRRNKTGDNEKMLFPVIVHTHRLLAPIPTRLNNNYFLTTINPSKATPILRQRYCIFFVLRQHLSLRHQVSLCIGQKFIKPESPRATAGDLMTKTEALHLSSFAAESEVYVVQKDIKFFYNRIGIQ